MADQPSTTCPQCGAPLGPADHFCGRCGTAIASAGSSEAAGAVATGPAAAPPPGSPVAAGPPEDSVRISKRTLVVTAVVAALALLAAGLVLLNRDDGDEVVATGGEAGEIFLEPAASLGPGPFSEDVLEDDPIPTTTSSTTSTVATTTTTPGTTAAVASVQGGAPGLYGGTRNSARCDREAMIRFLEADSAKAAAWVAALNADPTLRWSGGTQIRIDQIGAYLRELTPVTLTRDTA